MNRWPAVLILAVAACAPGAETAAPTPAPAITEPAVAPPATAPAESPRPGQTAADQSPAALAWTAPLVAGGQLNGGDLTGRDVVLWFWAPW